MLLGYHPNPLTGAGAGVPHLLCAGCLWCTASPFPENSQWLNISHLCPTGKAHCSSSSTCSWVPLAGCNGHKDKNGYTFCPRSNAQVQLVLQSSHALRLRLNSHSCLASSLNLILLTLVASPKERPQSLALESHLRLSF